MAYNQDNSVTYDDSGADVNTGYRSVISASKGVTYRPSKGFIMGVTGDCFITCSDGSATIIAAGDQETTYAISIIGYNPTGGGLNNVTLLY